MARRLSDTDELAAESTIVGIEVALIVGIVVSLPYIAFGTSLPSPLKVVGIGLVASSLFSLWLGFVYPLRVRLNAQKIPQKVEADLAILTAEGVVSNRTIPELIGRTQAQEKQRLEEVSKEKERLRGYLKVHYEKDILPEIESWLDSVSPTARLSTEPRATYDVPDLAFAAYNAPSGIYKGHLDFQASRAEEVKAHLGSGGWAKWETLRDLTNSQLDKVVEIWRDIEKDVREFTKGLGLDEWDGFFRPIDAPARTGPPKEYFWLHRLLYQIWQGSDWASLEVSEYDDSFYQTKMWQYAGGAARSQKREPLDKLKAWLPTESSNIATKRAALPSLTPIESALVAFRKMQGEIDYDYHTRHSDKAGVGIASLPNSCSICKDWIDKIRGQARERY